MNKALEDARGANQIGSALQAAVKIVAPAADAQLLSGLGEELRFVLITSAAQVTVGEHVAVTVDVAAGTKCERCWHVTVDVGANAEHPTLCARCIGNLSL